MAQTGTVFGQFAEVQYPLIFDYKCMFFKVFLYFMKL